MFLYMRFCMHVYIYMHLYVYIHIYVHVCLNVSPVATPRRAEPEPAEVGATAGQEPQEPVVSFFSGSHASQGRGIHTYAYTYIYVILNVRL